MGFVEFLELKGIAAESRSHRNVRTAEAAALIPAASAVFFLSAMSYQLLSL
jgi:hypothetical protein